MSDIQDTGQQNKLDELKKQEAEELAEMLSKKYNLPYIDLSVVSINTDALRLVPEEEARAAGIAAFKIVAKKVSVIIATPNNPKVAEILGQLKEQQYEVQEYMGSFASLERAWERYKEISYSMETRAGLVGVSDEQLAIFLETAKNINDVKGLIEETIKNNKTQGVSKVLEIIIAGAVTVGASDIHIEAQEKETRLRFRLDGVLQDISEFSPAINKLILSRLKLISGLKLNIKAEAQDGRFSISTKNKQIEVRTSILPGPYGESVVMRLLDPDSISITLDKMGMEPRLLEVLEAEIAKPNGMILVTGPTGSGKSTTLYACLRKVNEPGSKILTIEDPIEYHLAGISQTQVNESSGYTFLEGLRAALRQDPDIIMIGEIRDNETAKIAINSALTGHLVFSTLHTNSAAGAIPRLIDLGVNPKVIGSALNLMLAQRLVRKLCQNCKKESVPTEKQAKYIATAIESAKEKGIVLGTINPQKVWVAGSGCTVCNNIGYKGRIGIYEAIVMDSAIEKLIDQNPSEREINKAAIPQGILNMTEDGIIKVLRGITSFDEVERVVELGSVLVQS
ncbi:MAG: type II/IV secretion system protein [Candidatus Vogelbacteria bacterium]|nr:type II/IV secretion system protein [Candidatus Vogelbacteria bacterium]